MIEEIDFLKLKGYNLDKGNNILLFYYLSDFIKDYTINEINKLKEQIAEGSKIFDISYIWGYVCYRPDYIWLIDRKDIDSAKCYYFLKDDKGELLLDDEKDFIYDVNAMEPYWKNYIKIPFEEFFKIVIGCKEYRLSKGKDKV